MDDTFDVDLVYLWVDGSDPLWLAKKNAELPKFADLDINAAAKGRFCNNDELKYSLRSVEKFAGWINKIYIVTDSQIPEWLNTRHPKITVINHKDIMPPEALPCFNSLALEARIHHIEGLSEHFLYANDDMFFAGKTDKSFFFEKSGIPIVRLGKRLRTDEDNIHLQVVKNAQDKIFKTFGFRIKNIPHHNIDAYTKTNYINCMEVFEEDFKKTALSKFRHRSNMARVIVDYYAAALKRARMKIVRKVDTDLPFHKRALNTLAGIYEIDSIYVYPKKIRSCKKKLKKLKPKLFCINDSEIATDEQRVQIRNFLDEFFFEKSGFECL
ncbi:MAG: Stealth CR1 domain-containing protein [Heliobacteriaceae bacterium]|jgi:hypothetical protein|nr:Stealth CR1 domain-containing protein [Heliobacteriaceae bacterium]